MPEAIKYASNEDEFEYRAETFLKAVGDTLLLYVPGANQEIKMLIGRDAQATIKFSGPITQDAIMDVMAHLSFYKKYFPKNEDAPGAHRVESIVQQYRAVLAEDRASRAVPQTNS